MFPGVPVSFLAMGAHIGLIAAKVGTEALLAALSAADERLMLIEKFVVRDEADIGDAFGRAGDAAYVVIEHNGATVLWDGELVLSTNADLVQQISKTLGCVVVGGFAASSSGMYGLHVMKNGRVVRSVEALGDGAEPKAEGDPLPCEATAPLDGVNLDGVEAAIGLYGMEVRPGGAECPARLMVHSMNWEDPSFRARFANVDEPSSQRVPWWKRLWTF